MRKLPSLRKVDPEPPPEEPVAEPAPPSPSPVPRMSIKMMMMLTLVVAVAAAGYGGMRRGGESRAFYVIFATAAPLIVLVIAGVAHQLFGKRSRKRR